LVTLTKGTTWTFVFVGIGIAVGVVITFALMQQREIQQGEVVYDDDNPWLDPLFLKSYQENLRIGSHYKSQIPVGEEGFFKADAKGGKDPYNFEWKFSDSVVLTDQNATRSFESAGEYTVQLTVSDGEGQQVGQELKFKVIPAS